MKIVKIELSHIQINENNLKEHPEWHVDQISKSIERYGYNDPIAVDENNMIIEGHGRYKALKLLGFENVEVIKLENLTQEQKRAYILAHNKIALNTGFEMGKLVEELSILKEFGEFEFIGFSDVEFRGLERKLERTIEDQDYSEKNKEIDLSGDEYNFTCTCPKCGFEFNQE